MTFIKGGVAARLLDEAIHDRLGLWLQRLGEDSFVTFMSDGAAARLLNTDFDYRLRQWLAALDVVRFVTFIKGGVPARLHLLDVILSHADELKCVRWSKRTWSALCDRIFLTSLHSVNWSDVTDLILVAKCDLGPAAIATALLSQSASASAASITTGTRQTPIVVSASATVAPAPLSGARGSAAPKVKPKARSCSGSGSGSGSAIGGTDLPIQTAAVLPVTLTNATKQRRRVGADGASNVPGAGETGDKASPKETAPRKRRREY